mmetsp:Transcript_88633/g.251262  ORF Transcript_88633/g.251262 Transcript_88633/m.251262 type:complete len:200 (+) Transcript_88633:981-1580(+)
MSTAKMIVMTESMNISTGSASAASLNACRRRWNCSKRRSIFRILTIGTEHRRIAWGTVSTWDVGMTKPMLTRTASGAAATRSITLYQLRKKSARFGQATNLTTTSSRKITSMVVSTTAAGTPRSGGDSTLWRSVMQTVAMMNAGISLANHRAKTLDSGSSSALQTSSRKLNHRRLSMIFAAATSASNLVMRSEAWPPAL